MNLHTVTAEGVADIGAWVKEHATALNSVLSRHGAVLVRGLSVSAAEQLVEVRDALGLAEAATPERFAASTAVGGGVYTAPEWGADREMCLHHEQSYGLEIPRVLLMACRREPTGGGEILLGDTRATLAHLPADLLGRFRAEGWLLERNFRPYLGLPWTVAFGLDEPTELVAYGQARLMGVQWREDGSLHTVQRRSAVLRHPATDEECWCNDVVFLSQWSVEPEERQVLLSAFGPSGIPFNTSLGSGAPLTEAEWRGILDAYNAVTVRAPVGTGDLLIVDNLLTAHGRAPYQGPREVLVAPADPVSLARCRPSVPPLPGPESA